MDSKAREGKVTHVTVTGSQMELVRLLDAAKTDIMDKGKAQMRFAPGDDLEIRMVFDGTNEAGPPA